MNHTNSAEALRALGVCVVVLGVTVVLLAHALIKLREPLRVAVSIADRIAEGKPVRDEDFESPHGVGDLH